MLLLHHTAAKGDDKRRMAAFYAFKRADIAEDPVLCVFSHSAGVEYDYIRIVFIICKFTTHFCEHSLQPFAVRDILLTAIRSDESHRGLSPGTRSENITQKLRIFMISRKLVVPDIFKNLIILQNELSVL